MDNSKPLVSVLVPVCNVERYVRECINSLVTQSIENIEIICINDGSTDASGAVLEEFAQRDPRVKIITKPNSGYGDSMNKGLEMATGEYIAIVESDDFIDEDAFERLVALAQQHNAEVVKTNFYTHVTFADWRRDPVLPNLEHCECGKVFNPKENQNIFLTQPAIWSAIYRRSFLQENNISFLPTPGASFQDTSFNFKVFACAQRAYLSEEACLHYRIDNSNSSVKSLSKVFCICDEYQEMWRFLEQRNLLDVLGCRLAQIQYGGYNWNLLRLTPNLQYEFYQQFVKDFQTIKDKGFLKEDVFDPQVWADLSAMLENPDGFFRKKLGPIKVETSVVAHIPGKQPRVVLKAVQKLAAALGENDELICITNLASQQAEALFAEAHAADSRIFNSSSLFASATFQDIEQAEIRGKNIVAINLKTTAASALNKAALWIRQVSVPSLVGSDVVASRYAKAQFEQAGTPLFFPLLAEGFYLQNEYLPGALDKYREVIHASFHFPEPKPEIPGEDEASLKDFQAAKTAFDAFIKAVFTNCANGAASNESLKQVYINVLMPLWVELQHLYNCMDYNSRQLFGEKPSPLAYPALSAAGAPFEEENELKKPASVDVTVIIPVYNTAAYLEECLETVLGQDIPNLQVICVNDGSSDSSLALLEKAAAADSRVQVVSQLNGGAGAARNRAINLAKGRYLAFIDPDDTYPASNTLSMLLSKAKENNAAVCGGSFVSVLPEGKKKESYHGDADVYTVRQEGFRDFSQDEFDYGWIRFIYNRSLFEDGTVRFPEYRWYEDPVFLVRVMQKASQYYAVPETTYLYRADYKEPSWNAGKVRDLVNGLKHNYVFAKEQGWNRLYSLIVWRIEEDYYLPIVNCLGDDEVMATISEIQARLDLSRVAYLRERNLKVRVLRPLKDYPLTNRKTAVVRQAEKISDSSMYKALQNVIERKREGHR